MRWRRSVQWSVTCWTPWNVLETDFRPTHLTSWLMTSEDQTASLRSDSFPDTYPLMSYAHQLIRPPGTVVPAGLIFYCCLFLSSLWHFAALYLREGWGDRHETFTHDWKCGHLDFGCLKFWGLPPKEIFGVNGLGAKSQSPLSRSPRNFAKRCELGKY